MTVHDIRNRLVTINKHIAQAKNECCYMAEYDKALDGIRDLIIQLGDDLDKSTGEERV